MKANSAKQPNQFRLYNALVKLKHLGKLHTLQDAEKLLARFGTNIHTRNVIEFDVESTQGTHKECLYEYSIPLSNGIYTTFYIDQHLGFECGERLPELYKETIRNLHLADNSYTNTLTIH